MMLFTIITEDLQKELKSNLPQIRFLLKKNPAIAYRKITEIGKFVGVKYGITLVVNFSGKGMINDFDMYGKRDLSIIVDREKKNFPIDRSIIKEKAKEIFGDIKVEDAYMYEGKEGVRTFTEGGKIDILPHSVHIWCEFTDRVTKFCDWLLENVYQLKPNLSS